MWSKKYDECVKCGSSERKHVGRGLCSLCYSRDWGNKNADKLRKQRHEWYIRSGGKNRARILREERYYAGKRNHILERDGYKCVKCGEDRVSQLIVHHGDGSGRGSKEHNNEDDNLVTWCRSCHARHHSPHRGRIYKPAGWSACYSACIECGTTERPHGSKGLCKTCYARKLRAGKGYMWTGWSFHYEHCIDCGTTEVKHHSKGLCTRCYDKKRREEARMKRQLSDDMIRTHAKV